MTPRIITADEAAALLRDTTPAPWMRDGLYVRNNPHEVALARALDDEGHACGETHAPNNARLIAAAPDLAATVVAQSAEIERLRAIINGRTTPPTDSEIRDVARAGLTVILHAIDSRTGRVVDLSTLDVHPLSVWAAHHADGHFTSAVWRLIDANDRPCAWPVPSESR